MVEATADPVEAPAAEVKLEAEQKLEQETQDALPEHLRGKSVSELAKIINDKDTHIGERDKTLGDLKSRVSQYDNYYALQQQQAQQAQQAAAPVENKDEFDYDKPLSSVDKRIDEKLGKFQEQLANAYGTQEKQRAYGNYVRGRDDSFKQNPKLFKGIEEPVATAMEFAYKNRIFTAEDMADPKKWAQTARVQRALYDEGNSVQGAVSATPTETPGTAKADVRPSNSGLDMDDYTRMLINHRPKGQTEDEFIKKVMARRKTEGR